MLFKTKKQPPPHQDDSEPALFSLLFESILHIYIFLHIAFSYTTPVSLSSLSLLIHHPQLFSHATWLCAHTCHSVHHCCHSDSAANCTITKSLISRVAVSPALSEARLSETERERNHIIETKNRKRKLDPKAHTKLRGKVCYSVACACRFPLSNPPTHVKHPCTNMWSLWKTGDDEGSWKLSVPTDPEWKQKANVCQQSAQTLPLTSEQVHLRPS